MLPRIVFFVTPLSERQRDTAVCCSGETEATAFLDILMKSNVTLPLRFFAERNAREGERERETDVTVRGCSFGKESIVTEFCIY